MAFLVQKKKGEEAPSPHLLLHPSSAPSMVMPSSPSAIFSSIIPSVPSKYSDNLTILTISILMAILIETISYILIYRTTSYKSLRSSILKSSKNLDLIKTPPSNPSKKAHDKSKKIDHIKTALKESTRDLSLSKFKSGAVVALVLFAVFGFLNSLFEGKVVVKLSFQPAAIIQKMSHRGLAGDDPTDYSMAFMYFLCSISIRTNVQKFLGFTPPRGAIGAGLFLMPDPKTS